VLQVFESYVLDFTGQPPTPEQMELFPIALELSSASACYCATGELRVRILALFPKIEEARRIYTAAFSVPDGSGGVSTVHAYMVPEQEKGLLRYLSLASCRPMVSYFVYPRLSGDRINVTNFSTVVTSSALNRHWESTRAFSSRRKYTGVALW
jgi:hypothetical protein